MKDPEIWLLKLSPNLSWSYTRKLEEGVAGTDILTPPRPSPPFFFGSAYVFRKAKTCTTASNVDLC